MCVDKYVPQAPTSKNYCLEVWVCPRFFTANNTPLVGHSEVRPFMGKFTFVERRSPPPQHFLLDAISFYIYAALSFAGMH
jgi:hypothetical protein